MPIILGAQASNARWNKKLLILLWILQLIVVIFLEFMAWFIAALDSWGGASSMRYVSSLAAPIYRSNSYSMFCLTFFLANLVLFGQICREFSHVHNLDHMTARWYYRCQLVKSLYLAVFPLWGLIAWLSHPSFDLGPLMEGLLTMMFPL
jgi:hypothetical protein